jgi:hypothetical protein
MTPCSGTNYLAGLLQTQATVHHAAGGLTGWQVALIGVSLPLAAAAVTVLLRLRRAARRAAPSPTA